MRSWLVEMSVEVPAADVPRVVRHLQVAGVDVSRDGPGDQVHAVTTATADTITQAIELAVWEVNSVALGDVVALTATADGDHRRGNPSG